jgi:hypothetical protein
VEYDPVSSTGTASAKAWDRIIRAYVFADFYLVQYFKSRVLDLFYLRLIALWELPMFKVSKSNLCVHNIGLATQEADDRPRL